MPAAALLLQFPFLLETGQDAVEVVLLDAHLGGQLGDGDAGLSLHERERLTRARAAAFAPSGAPFRGGGRGFDATAERTAYFFAGRTTNFAGRTANFAGRTAYFFGFRAAYF